MGTNDFWRLAELGALPKRRLCAQGDGCDGHWSRYGFGSQKGNARPQCSDLSTRATDVQALRRACGSVRVILIQPELPGLHPALQRVYELRSESSEKVESGLSTKAARSARSLNIGCASERRYPTSQSDTEFAPEPCDGTINWVTVFSDRAKLWSFHEPERRSLIH